VIFLNTQMDLFILKTDVEKFTSTSKKTLHMIFKERIFVELLVAIAVVSYNNIQYTVIRLFLL